MVSKRRRRQDPRLRPRQAPEAAAGGESRSADRAGDAGRHGPRHGRLHVAGAGERQGPSTSASDQFSLGLDPLRDGDGQAGLPAGHDRRDADRDHPRGRRAGRPAQRGRSGAVPLDRRAVPARRTPRSATPRRAISRGTSGASASTSRRRRRRRDLGDVSVRPGAARRRSGPLVLVAAGRVAVLAALRRRDAPAEAPRSRSAAAVLPADHVRQRHDPRPRDSPRTARRSSTARPGTATP